jgi:hypothetical protein
MTAVSTRRHMRRWAKLAISGVATTFAALALGAPPVTAEFGVPGTCSQDGFAPVPSGSVQNGTQKDRNHNGWVCAKVQDGRVVGGPDDDVIV